MQADDNYSQALAQLFSLWQHGLPTTSRRPELHTRRTQAMLKLLGNPHHDIPTIHIAGSTGKGSVAAMLEVMLRAAGLNVGLFVSPSLFSYTERIVVNGLPVSKAEFVVLFRRVWPVGVEVASMTELGPTTVFEQLTVMAFLCFAERSCGAAVIETGLGGRFDSTNVVTPVVSVITRIGLDHTDILGTTLTEIAADKAGIIKPTAPVVVGMQPPDALRVLRATAAEHRTPLVEANTAIKEARRPVLYESGQQLNFTGSGRNYRFRLPLLGNHQAQNAQIAIAALEASGLVGKDHLQTAVTTGLQSVRLMCRVQVVHRRGHQFIIDGAHSPDAAIALRNAVMAHFPHLPPAIAIIGGTRGHDYTAVATEIKGLVRGFINTSMRHPKARDSLEVATALRGNGLAVLGSYQDTASAITAAQRAATADERAQNAKKTSTPIIVCGSLFVAAEAIEVVLGLEPELYSL